LIDLFIFFEKEETEKNWRQGSTNSRGEFSTTSNWVL